MCELGMNERIGSTLPFITESIESLQTTTNNLKTSLDQKACKILNKTEAVFEKVKTHTESFNTFADTTSTPKHQKVDTNKTLNYPKKAVNKTKNSNVDTNTKNSGKFTNVINKPHVSKGRPNLRLHQKRNQSPNITELSNERDNPIDLTEKKQIKQTTLLVGSSILKGIKTKELKPNTTVRSFPGATTETLKEKMCAYNLDNCKTIIVHVSGNDVDDGKDLETFCDDFISLLENLVDKDRRIIVSGLLPLKIIDLKPYNEKLKSLCEEMNIDFTNDFDSFLFAPGEIPAAYFARDKIHLNVNGTRKFLSNIDKICKVSRPASQIQTFPSNRKFQFGGGSPSSHARSTSTKFGGGRPSSHAGRGSHSLNKLCHICFKRGHSTQECYYNVKAAGSPGYISL